MKWPTCGQSGYVTPALRKDLHRCRGAAKSEVAHKLSAQLGQPWRLGDPHCFRVGCKIRSGPLVGKVATSPLPSQKTPPLQSRGQNRKLPTYERRGYVTPAISGIPTVSEREQKSEVAHLWAKWLRHPCRLGDRQRCTAGGNIRSCPLVGNVATSPLPSRASPPLQTGGQNQKWPSFRQAGYVPSEISGIPTASQRAEKSEVAHSSPLPSRGSPPLQSGGQNQKWPTSGQGGCVTPAL